MMLLQYNGLNTKELRKCAFCDLSLKNILKKEHKWKLSRKGIKTELSTLMQYCSQASKIRYRKYK